MRPSTSLDDPKVWPESLEVTPLDVNVIDASKRGAFVSPANEVCEDIFRSFGKDLDAAVGAIFNPTSEP